MAWRDLSDDELRARLAARLGPPASVDLMVDARETEEIAALIDEILS